MTASFYHSDAAPLGGLHVVELPGIATLHLGKTLADLGAEVVKVEPPGGDPARRMPPLAPGQGNADSLAWLALNLGKQSILLDPDAAEGQAGLAHLLADADVLLDGRDPAFHARSSQQPPGAPAERGTRLSRLITVSMTPFGLDGPRASWKGSDLVQFAMGGYLHMTGPADGTPIKPSAPLQSQMLAGNHALVALLLALRHRRLTGRGAHVDQSMRDAIPWMLTHTYQYWDMERRNLARQGAGRDFGGARARLKSVYPVKDGHIVWMFQTGHIGAKSATALVAWMDSLGFAPDWLKALDWNAVDLLRSDPDLPELLDQAFAAFFRSRTREEMLAWSLDNGLMLASLQGLPEVAEDLQLASREAWRTVVQPAVGGLRVPGPPARISGMTWEPRGPAPAPGAGQGFTPRSPAVASTAPGAGPRLPLEGIRVLDLGTTLAGPCAARHLADFGAEVIKVESEAHPDTLRVGTPYAGGEPGINRSGYFGAYNAGKLSFAIDLRRTGALAVFRRLVEASDVVMENFAPGVTGRLGITPEDLRSWNPRVIVASHSLQGQHGPRARHRGYGQIASGMTGWYDLTGLEGDEPLGPYSAYTDFLSWPYLAAAVIIALERRDLTGEGATIDHAQVESSIHFLAPALLDLQLNGHALTRRGNHEDAVSPNNAYRCAGEDRWLAITAASDDDWRALCAAIGRPDLAADPTLATLAGRKARETDVDAAIEAWTASHEPWEAANALQAAGIAAGPVFRAQDLFEDPQLQQRGLFRRLDHPELGNHAVITNSFRVAGLEPGPFEAAPLLGDHTYDICSRVLGLDDDEFVRYQALGVFR